MKRCAHCGQHDHDEAILCKKCGRSIAGVGTSGASTGWSSSVTSFVAIAAILAAVYYAKQSGFFEQALSTLKKRIHRVGTSRPASTDRTAA